MVTALRSRFSLFLACCLCVCLAACRDASEPPPAGLAGLEFGDPPAPGLTPLRVPLPAALAGDLAYWRRSGPAGAFLGVPLVDPIFAFWRGRLFSVAVNLADPDGVARLGRALEAAYGPALGTVTRAGGSRLWRLRGVDLALEQGREGHARFLVRSRALAEELAQWRAQALPLEREAGN